MNKSEILQHLRSNHSRFSKLITGLPDSDFLRSTNGKWTPGQQLDHIVKSVRPVSLALLLPNFFLRIAFGKANRPSRSYEELVAKYHAKLETGYKASAPFIPKAVATQDRDGLSKRLQVLTNSLSDQINSYTENQLDTFLLPHPLLGKLTLREMLYFTIYHAEHHEKQTMNNLENKIMA